MSADPYRHHPGLRGRIIDPQESFFREFRVETILAAHPELEPIRPHLHSDATRDANRKAALDGHMHEDLWVFAYGSLMWDPAFYFSEVRRTFVPQYARRFILREVYGGRGTKEAPGLMAALDHGDGCDGLLFKIPQAQIEEETEILWRRELVAPGYVPTFVTAQFADQTAQALTFVADHDAEQICGDISHAEQINCLANGAGILGTSLEYLENIVAQFDALGISDPHCTQLLADARAAQAAL
ncbi:gamma-glutamylcyclotransferase [Cognatishimia sp. SS12]|uniref:gamma-glutamylcyclotransferase n=1 Tax=Cognatishimia sp. SS12 TaxID=2979465 RepID=UPI00232BCA26|nr:gamma-glutamylcyclotransferase [Cognatishimia sp. SS12]MDC0737372.1 gamma-glutamylcyclotransferase [Cognatishimia sp. SS12]